MRPAAVGTSVAMLAVQLPLATEHSRYVLAPHLICTPSPRFPDIPWNITARVVISITSPQCRLEWHSQHWQSSIIVDAE